MSVELDKEIKVSGNKATAIFILLFPVFLMVMASWIYKTGTFMPTSRFNKGHLVQPVVPIESLHLKNEAGLEVNNEAFIGSWSLLVVGNPECVNFCKHALYNTRQIHKALGRNSSRLKRFFVGGDLASESVFAEQPGLVRLRANTVSSQSYTKNNSYLNFALGEDVIFLIDPLGSIMMCYDKDHSGKQVLKDIENLMKLSKVG